MIREPLSTGADDSAVRALLVVNSALDSVRIAEVKLRKITMKVLFAAVLVNAFHAALEDRVIAFRRVRVDLHARFTIGVAVLAAGVVNSVMLGELIAKLA